jgi:hypothetical protein
MAEGGEKATVDASETIAVRPQWFQIAPTCGNRARKADCQSCVDTIYQRRPLAERRG